MSSHLRIYFGPDDSSDVLAPKLEKKPSTVVDIKLGDILEALHDAKHADRLWLKDFAEESITISKDLYEVLAAYDKYRKTSA